MEVELPAVHGAQGRCLQDNANARFTGNCERVGGNAAPVAVGARQAKLRRWPCSRWEIAHRAA